MDAEPTLLELVVVGVPVGQEVEDTEAAVVIVLARVKAEVIEKAADLEGLYEGEMEAVKVAEMVPVTEMVEETETMAVEVEEGVTANGDQVAVPVAVTVEVSKKKDVKGVADMVGEAGVE